MKGVKQYLAIDRPDLIKYLTNKNDCIKPLNYRKRVSLTCPTCGSIKFIYLKSLATYGFSCSGCSGGASMPEKFLSNILKQSGIKFHTQHSFNDDKTKRYDFYIPSIDTIIETHGRQHFIQANNWVDVDIQKQIDINKKVYTITNGIKRENYIEIDCSDSSYEFLKNRYIDSLAGIVNINLAYEESQKSIVIDVVNEYNKNKKSLKELSKEFNMSKTTIISYLKIGTQLKLCKYNANTQKIKQVKKIGKDNSIKIYRCDLNGKILSEYKSLANAERYTGIQKSNINKCLKGVRKTAGGYIWKYADKVNNSNELK